MQDAQQELYRKKPLLSYEEKMEVFIVTKSNSKYKQETTANNSEM